MEDLALVTAADAANPVVGDLMLTDGQLVVVSGRDAIAQDLSVCLRWFRSEWFLDRRLGMPWFQRVLGIENGAGAIESVVRKAVTQRPGVASIVRIVVSVDTADRSATIDLEVRTIDGDLVSVPPFNLGELVPS